jgi:antitoxin component YwqK of YwqJK toxin-antitoxin module
MELIGIKQAVSALVGFLVDGTVSSADAANTVGTFQSQDPEGKTLAARMIAVGGAGSDVIGILSSGGQMLQQFAANSTDAGELLGGFAKISGYTALAAAVGDVVNTASDKNKGFGQITSGQLDAIGAAILGITAGTVAAPEVALAISLAAAAMTVAGWYSQGDSNTIGAALDALKGAIQPYLNGLSSDQLADFTDSFSNSTSEILSGGLLVPQLDSSGNFLASAFEVPTSVTSLSGGLTKFTFDGGTTLTVGASSDPHDRSWSISLPGGGVAELQESSRSGNFSVTARDASGNLLNNLVSGDDSAGLLVPGTVYRLSPSARTVTETSTDASGHSVVREFRNGGGYNESNIANGVVVTQTVHNADGSSVVTSNTSTGQLSVQQSFDANGNLTSTTKGATYVNGKLTAANVYDANGKRTGYEIFDQTTGLMTEDRHFDPITGQQTSTTLYRGGVPYAAADIVNGRQVDYQWLDEQGRVTAQNLLNENGTRTNYQIFDTATGKITEDRKFDPSTGQQTSATLYQGGVPYAIANVVNGRQVDFQWLDGDGRVTAQNLYNDNGARIRYQLLDPATGMVVEDRQFDPVSGVQSRTLLFNQDGKLVGLATFDKGKQVGFEEIDAVSQQTIERREYNPDSGKRTRSTFFTDGVRTAEAEFDANGAQVGWSDIDPTSQQVTRHATFDPSSGHQILNTYYTNGVRTAEATYDANGRQIGWSDIDPASQQVTRHATFDPSSGQRTSNTYYTNGVRTAEATYDANGRQIGWSDIDPASQQVTRHATFDPSSGQRASNTYYTNGVRTGEATYDANGRQTGWSDIDPASQQVTRHTEYNPDSGQPTATTNYQNGVRVSEATFDGNGKQISWSYIDPASQQVTDARVLDPDTHNIVERTTFSDGHAAIATYDRGGNWIDTVIHETTDRNSAVVSKYWIEDGKLHRSWTDNAGHGGESTYKGTTTDSGLLYSNFVDGGGYRHEQDYTVNYGIDHVYHPSGYKMYDARQNREGDQVVLFFVGGGVATTPGRLSDAAEAAASLSGASGIVSPIVPTTPNIMTTPSASGGILLPAGSYGTVTGGAFHLDDSGLVDPSGNPVPDGIVHINATRSSSSVPLASSDSTLVDTGIADELIASSINVDRENVDCEENGKVIAQEIAFVSADCTTEKRAGVECAFELQIDSLIQAMAGDGASSSATGVLTAVPSPNPQIVLAANWH